MNRILAVVGMTGSGKSVACDALRGQGWAYIRFGQVTIDRLIEAGREVTPESEREVREALRRERGMGAYAEILLPRIEAALERGDVVLDGLYSWSEYKILKRRFPDSFQVAHIHAAPAVRYRRLAERLETENDAARTVRRMTAEEARARDYAEIEGIEKGGPIAMADHVIINEGSLAALQGEILRVARAAGRPEPT